MPLKIDFYKSHLFYLNLNYSSFKKFFGLCKKIVFHLYFFYSLIFEKLNNLKIEKYKINSCI